MAAAARRSASPPPRSAAASAAVLPANAAHLASFERHLAIRPPTTRIAYVGDVGALARAAGDTDLLALTTRDLRRHLATLHGGGLGGRSLARMLSSWRAFYRFAIERDAGLAENPCAGLRPPKSAKRLPSALSPDEAVRLVSIDGDGVLELRDRALLELAYSSGLRLAELAGLDLDRLDLARGEVRVLGKGAKERIVPVGVPARDALHAWLAARASIDDVDAEAVFVGRAGRRITRRAIQRRFAEWAVRQGLPRHVHPHMLRHSFASHLLQSSGDLRAVQELLGHASIASTQVYTHLDFQYLAKAYDQAHPRAKRARSKP
jgi:integrase/recombinase XerC